MNEQDRDEVQTGLGVLAPPEAAERQPIRLPASQAFAASIGNQAMTRLASRVADDPPRALPATDQILTRAIRSSGPQHGEARQLLQRALDRSEAQPGSLESTGQPAQVGGKCGCGGSILPGGECSRCMGRRLLRQGMPRREVQRIVLARTKAGSRQVSRGRSFTGCLNAHLAGYGIGWAMITILGGICGVIGAIAGLAGGPAAPATVPSGLAMAAAICIAVATGLAVGSVLGAINHCWSNPDEDHPFVRTASAEGAGGGEAAPSGGETAVA